MKSRLALLPLLLLSSHLFAQEALRTVTHLTTGAGVDTRAWADSLDRALSRSDRIALVQRSPEGRSSVEEAGRLGYPLAVEVSLTRDGDLLVTEWTLFYAVTQGALAHEVFKSAEPTEEDREEFHWLSLLAKVATIQFPGHTLLIEAPPGTRIQGFDKPILMGETGQVVIDVTIPAIYPWTARLKGHVAKQGLFAAVRGDEKLSILLEEVRPWSAEFSIRDIAWPELRASRSFLSDTIAVRAGFSQRLFGFSWENENSSGEADSFRGVGLFEPGAGILLYLRGTEKELRPYLAADAVLRLCRRDTWTPDPDARARLSLALGINWEIDRHLNLYLETGVDWFPGAYPEKMQYEEERSAAAVELPKSNYINLPTGIAGLRWRF